jgi:hypothetical protein
VTSFRTAGVLVLGATVLVALAVQFRPVRQAVKPPAVPAPAVLLASRNAGGDQELSQPVSDQGVQRTIVAAEHVEAGVEPVSTTHDAASAASWSYEDMPRTRAELQAMDLADRAPRPFVPGCITLPPTAFLCPGDWLLLREEVDPEWSHATEERLRAIWEENVTGFSSEYLFVMCKTTLCQINYRFAPGTSTGASLNPQFILFDRGFRASALASELRWRCGHYGKALIAWEYERKSLPGRTSAAAATSDVCSFMPRPKQQGL